MENKTILIVEDETIIAMDIKAKLEDLNYVVAEIVSTGEDAVKKAAEIRPDLVLTDIMLKGKVDGIKAASKILALDIPVVYLTAYSDEVTLRRAMKKPPYGYLIKPVDKTKLKSTVKMAIQKHESYMKQLEEIENGILPRKITRNRINNEELAKSSKKPRIVIVEDERINAMDTAYRLGNLGYSVVATVQSGEDAIDTANKLHPDLMLMDIKLKGHVSGIEVAKQIQKLDIPVVFLTSYSDERTLHDVKLVSPSGYLIKPFDEAELYSAVETALKKYQADTNHVQMVEDKIKNKSDELKIEKTGVFFVTAIVLSLAVYGVSTRNMTWLEYLLFVPAVYNLTTTIVSLQKQEKPDTENFHPFVSILIPAHNEEHTIARCVKTLSKVDYCINGQKNYEIIVINDGSTDKTDKVLKELKKSLNDVPLKVVTRKPPRSGKGKGYVLNDGFELCKGEIVAVFDADARVKPNFLKKAVPYLNEKGVDGVQARVQMYNKDRNLLTAMQEVEFAIFGNVILKAKDLMGKAAYLGGNGQLTTKTAIKSVQGWDGYAVTEDLNMSIKLLIKGSKIRYCPEAVVYQEAVPHWKPFFRQRVRWATGNLETLFVYLNPIINAPISVYRKIDSIMYLFFLLFLAFVIFGYMIVILYLGFLFQFSLSAPVMIAIFSTIAFFPGLIIGIYKDTKKIHVAFYRSIEYWAYCFYLIPLFFAAFINMVTRNERHWAKTYHSGEELGDITSHMVSETLYTPKK